MLNREVKKDKLFRDVQQVNCNPTAITVSKMSMGRGIQCILGQGTSFFLVHQTKTDQTN